MLQKNQVKNTLHELFIYSEPGLEEKKNNSSQIEIDDSQTDSDSNSEPPKPNVAAPIRPVFLLNLLLEDDRESSKLYEPYLAAFKRWYVRKRTSEARDRDIDQTPEHDRNNKELGGF